MTLEQLETDARLYADSRPGGAAEFVGTTDIRRLLNQKIREWQDLLIAQRPPDQVIQHQYFNVVGADAGYSFAAGDRFYSLVTAQLLWNGASIDTSTDVEEFNRIDWKDAGRYSGLPWGRGSPKGYTLGEGSSDNIVIYPTPTSSVILFVRYIQAFADLVPSPGPGHTVATYNGWEKLVTLGVAIELLAIAGRDSSHLQKLHADQLQRLQTLAAERIVCEPKQIRDVRPEGHYWPHDWARRLPPP